MARPLPLLALLSILVVLSWLFLALLGDEAGDERPLNPSAEIGLEAPAETVPLAREVAAGESPRARRLEQTEARPPAAARDFAAQPETGGILVRVIHDRSGLPVPAAEVVRLEVIAGEVCADPRLLEIDPAGDR